MSSQGVASARERHRSSAGGEAMAYHIETASQQRTQLVLSMSLTKDYRM